MPPEGSSLGCTVMKVLDLGHSKRVILKHFFSGSESRAGDPSSSEVDLGSRDFSLDSKLH